MSDISAPTPGLLPQRGSCREGEAGTREGSVGICPVLAFGSLSFCGSGARVGKKGWSLLGMIGSGL